MADREKPKGPVLPFTGEDENEWETELADWDAHLPITEVAPVSGAAPLPQPEPLGSLPEEENPFADTPITVTSGPPLDRRGAARHVGIDSARRRGSGRVLDRRARAAAGARSAAGRRGGARSRDRRAPAAAGAGTAGARRRGGVRGIRRRVLAAADAALQRLRGDRLDQHVRRDDRARGERARRRARPRRRCSGARRRARRRPRCSPIR